jgi:hypothetical protein
VWASLVVISVVLTVAIVASIQADKRMGGDGPNVDAPHPDDPHHSAAPEIADDLTAPPEAREPFLDIDREPRNR